MVSVEAKGKEEGRIEGIEIGENKSIEKIVLNMLRQKLDDDLIKSATNLSKTDLDKFKKKISLKVKE